MAQNRFPLVHVHGRNSTKGNYTTSVAVPNLSFFFKNSIWKFVYEFRLS